MSIDIFEAFLRGDPDGFRPIYFTYQYPLFRFAMTMTPRIDVAEDAVTEAFTLLWEKRHIFQSGLHIRRFLYLVVLNICRTQRRLGRRFNLLPKGWDTVDPDASELIAIRELAAHNQWIINKIYEHLKHLPKQRSQDFHAHIFELKSYKQIARERGANAGTVRMNVELATKEIRNYLKANAYPGISKNS